MKLGRKLGLGAVIALGVGTTVGSGIFSSLSEVANAAGSSLSYYIHYRPASDSSKLCIFGIKYLLIQRMWTICLSKKARITTTRDL